MNRLLVVLLACLLLPSWAYATRDSTFADTTVVAPASVFGKTSKVLLIRPGAWIAAQGRAMFDTIGSQTGVTIVLQGNFNSAAGYQHDFKYVLFDTSAIDSLTAVGKVSLVPTSGTVDLTNATTTIGRDSSTAAITSGSATGLDTLSTTGGATIGGRLTANGDLLAALYDAIVDSAGKGHYTSIDAAIDGGAKSIYVRRGTYNENVTCDVAGLLIYGEARDRVLVNGGTAAPAFTVTAADVTIRNLSFRTTPIGGTDYSALQYGVNSNRLWIDGCHITGSDGSGIINTSAADSTLVGITITNNIVFNTDYTGLSCVGKNVFVSNNYIYSCTTSGISLGTTVYRANSVISDNVIFNVGSVGIAVFGKYTTITGNNISQTGNDGMWLQSVTADSSLVVGNIIRDHGAEAIDNDATGVILDNNQTTAY